MRLRKPIKDGVLKGKKSVRMISMVLNNSLRNRLTKDIREAIWISNSLKKNNLPTKAAIRGAIWIRTNKVNSLSNRPTKDIREAIWISNSKTNSQSICLNSPRRSNPKHTLLTKSSKIRIAKPNSSHFLVSPPKKTHSKSLKIRIAKPKSSHFHLLKMNSLLSKVEK